MFDPEVAQPENEMWYPPIPPGEKIPRKQFPPRSLPIHVPGEDQREKADRQAYERTFDAQREERIRQFLHPSQSRRRVSVSVSTKSVTRSSRSASKIEQLELERDMQAREVRIGQARQEQELRRSYFASQAVQQSDPVEIEQWIEVRKAKQAEYQRKCLVSSTNVMPYLIERMGKEIEQCRTKAMSLVQLQSPGLEEELNSLVQKKTELEAQKYELEAQYQHNITLPEYVSSNAALSSQRAVRRLGSSAQPVARRPCSPAIAPFQYVVSKPDSLSDFSHLESAISELRWAAIPPAFRQELDEIKSEDLPQYAAASSSPAAASPFLSLEAQDKFYCDFSNRLMEEPVRLACKHTYDLKVIKCFGIFISNYCPACQDPRLGRNPNPVYSMLQLPDVYHVDLVLQAEINFYKTNCIPASLQLIRPALQVVASSSTKNMSRKILIQKAAWEAVVGESFAPEVAGLPEDQKKQHIEYDWLWRDLSNEWIAENIEIREVLAPDWQSQYWPWQPAAVSEMAMPSVASTSAASPLITGPASLRSAKHYFVILGGSGSGGQRGLVAIEGLLPKPEFYCPLTNRLMIDPVRCKQCKHVFERKAIVAYLDCVAKHCPYLGISFANTPYHCTSNAILRPFASLEDINDFLVPAPEVKWEIQRYFETVQGAFETNFDKVLLMTRPKSFEFLRPLTPTETLEKVLARIELLPVRKIKVKEKLLEISNVNKLIEAEDAEWARFTWDNIETIS